MKTRKVFRRELTDCIDSSDDVSPAHTLPPDADPLVPEGAPSILPPWQYGYGSNVSTALVNAVMVSDNPPGFKHPHPVAVKVICGDASTPYYSTLREAYRAAQRAFGFPSAERLPEGTLYKVRVIDQQAA